MTLISSPTLKNIAKSSLHNWSVEVVIDDINWKYHYLMSEQNYWERGIIPDIRKPTISLPSDLFFRDTSWEIYDTTDHAVISSKLKEILEWTKSHKIAA